MNSTAEKLAPVAPLDELRIELPGSAILYTCMRGRMTEEFAQRIVEAGDEIVARKGRILAFHDWEELDSYATEARRILVAWGVRIHRDIERVHIRFRSPLVAMGVSVAAIALGKILVTHRNRPTFDAALAEACERAGAKPLQRAGGA